MSMKSIKILSILCCLAVAAGCATSKPATKNRTVSNALTQQDILKGIEQMRSSQTYVLQPGDLVEIQVFMESNMTRTSRISSTGTVTFPLVGIVKVAGLSREAAEAKLAASLTTYLKNPQVSILVKEYGNKTVYVLGQVSKPAAIQIPPEKPLTVLEAITSVGGFTDIANTSKVRVLRMENGKQKSIDVDITQITKQGNKAMDITLTPGDVVFVPQSMF